MKKIIMLLTLSMILLMPSVISDISVAEKFPLTVDFVGDEVRFGGKKAFNSDGIAITTQNSDYAIKKLEIMETSKKITFLMDIDKSYFQDKINSTVNKPPRYLREKNYFVLYSAYEEYCEKFKDCLPIESYKNILFEYDIDGSKVFWDTLRKDEITGEIYPNRVLYNKSGKVIGIETWNLNKGSSLSVNDIVYSANMIMMVDGSYDCNKLFNFTQNVTPGCFYENATLATLWPNITTRIYKCPIQVNRTANFTMNSCGIIFDVNAMGSSGGLIRYSANGTYLYINNSLVSGMYSGDLSGYGGLNTIEADANTCSKRIADLGGFFTEFPCKGYITIRGSQFYNPTTTAVFENYIHNGTVLRTTTSGATFTETGTASMFTFDKMLWTGESIIINCNDMSGSKFTYSQPSGKNTCFLYVICDGISNIEGADLDCGGANMGLAVIATMKVNISNPTTLSSRVVSRVGGGSNFEVYYKYNLTNRYIEKNGTRTANVLTETNCTDALGNKYYGLGTIFNQNIPIESRISPGTPVVTTYMPLLCNITPSATNTYLQYDRNLPYNLTDSCSAPFWHTRIPNYNGYKYTMNSSQIYDISSGDILG